MKIAFSMPGRFGDIAWSLPTARALAETYDTPVHMVLSPKYGSLAELIRVQPYIADVTIDPAWEIIESAPMSPRIPPTPIDADHVYVGGYEGWPRVPLPEEIRNSVARQYAGYNKGRFFPAAEVSRPWIKATPWTQIPHPIVMGFSDEWFELKFGVSQLLTANPKLDRETGFVLAAPESRWVKEAGFVGIDWVEAARRIAASDVFLGCCSSLHVLAVGLGKPCVIMEPSQMRHQHVFWPLGMDGPKVWCVKGGDGLPTHDSRHTADLLHKVLSSVREGAKA